MPFLIAMSLPAVIVIGTGIFRYFLALKRGLYPLWMEAIWIALTMGLPLGILWEIGSDFH